MPEQFNVGDRWPDDQPGAEGATLVLVCYCGGHVDYTGGTCETCGRTFDEHGTRIIDKDDIDPDTDELLPVPTEIIVKES